jgi:sarcosine oxidase subunit beta
MGLKAIANAGVTRMEPAGSDGFRLSTPSGTISASVLVDATGPWSKQTGKMAGLDIPVMPVRRQWLTTSQIPEVPDDFPFVIDFAQSLYFHREGPGLLTGMSNPHEPGGFNQDVDPDWEMEHIEAAINRLPSIESAGLISRTAGLYENSPDAHPIIGRTPLENYFVITGFSGHGFMHGPIAGKLLAEIILFGSARSIDISMLDLARFTEGRLIQEYNVI